MTPETVMELAYRGMQMALMLAAPMLIAALAIGLLVSLFQAATQINEMTLSFIPKLLAIAAAIAIAGPWMIRLIVDYTRELIQSIPALIG